MGYYTQHQLSASDGMEEQYAEELAEIAGYNAENLLGNGEAIKWYDHDRDMKTLARRHPDVTFRLDGAGDENGDIWVEWYRGEAFGQWRLTLGIPAGFEPPDGWE